MVSATTLTMILLPVIGVYFLGFFMGKKSGYIKRVREEEEAKKLNS